MVELLTCYFELLLSVDVWDGWSKFNPRIAFQSVRKFFLYNQKCNRMQNGSELLACPCCKSAKYPPSAHVLDWSSFLIAIKVKSAHHIVHVDTKKASMLSTISHPSYLLIIPQFKMDMHRSLTASRNSRWFVATTCSKKDEQNRIIFYPLIFPILLISQFATHTIRVLLSHMMNFFRSVYQVCLESVKKEFFECRISPHLVFRSCSA